LLNSSIIGALMNAIEQSVRSVSWNFTSDLIDQELDDPRIEILDDSLAKMSHSWNDHIIEALTFLPYGFAPFEIVYQRDGGRVLWRKFAIRGQDTVLRWVLDENGGIQGLTQQITSGNKVGLIDIPIEKLILYRTRLERNNPEGRSILRNAYVSYYYAKNIEQVEAIGIERDLAGLPIIHLPAGASDEAGDIDKAEEIVRRIRNDEQAGLVLPDGWIFELASTNGRRLFDTDTIIGRYQREILMSVLAQFIMLGSDNVGSLALSKDQTDFFNMSVNTVADIISETITQYAIPRLLKLNGMDAEGVRLEHTPAGDANVEAIAVALQQLGNKVTWTADDEIWLRGVFGLPEMERDEIEVEREKKREMLPQFNKPDEARPGFSIFAADPPDEAQRTELERKWNDRWVEFLTKQRRRVLKAVKDIAG